MARGKHVFCRPCKRGDHMECRETYLPWRCVCDHVTYTPQIIGPRPTPEENL